MKKMKNNKATGPSGMTSEMRKALWQDGIDWLHAMLNDSMKQQRMPQDLKKSEIYWLNMTQQDLKSIRLKEDTGDRNKWRRRIHVAGPSLGRD